MVFRQSRSDIRFASGIVAGRQWYSDGVGVVFASRVVLSRGDSYIPTESEWYSPWASYIVAVRQWYCGAVVLSQSGNITSTQSKYNSPIGEYNCRASGNTTSTQSKYNSPIGEYNCRASGNITSTQSKYNSPIGEYNCRASGNTTPTKSEYNLTLLPPGRRVKSSGRNYEHKQI